MAFNGGFIGGNGVSFFSTFAGGVGLRLRTIPPAQVAQTVFNYVMFPGGGSEPPADYGGSAYTLNDVVFSIQPANSGPQSFGLSQAANRPTAATSLPFNELTRMSPSVNIPGVNTLKAESMANNLTLVRFQPSAYGA